MYAKIIQNSGWLRRTVDLQFLGWVILGSASVLLSCDTSSILEVQDPDVVTPTTLTGSEGASVLYAGALGEFAVSFSAGFNGQVLYTGLFADEFHHSGTFSTRVQIDRRDVDDGNGAIESDYRQLHLARVAAENAAEALQGLPTGPTDSRVAEMLNLAGFTYVFFGENYCSGVPFSHTPLTGDPSYGEPTTTQETFQLAIEKFDGALDAAESAGSSAQGHLASLGKARALLNLGRFEEAGEVAGAVPTAFSYTIKHSQNTNRQRNAIYHQNWVETRWSLSDREGGNGLPFRSANDPRVPWNSYGRPGFDSATPLYRQEKYLDYADPVALADGTEARLIEAEAALAGGDEEAWLQTLNDLRATLPMESLEDPGTASGREDLHFRERAFWLFATGHRLGDLRRLVRQYGRSAEAVLPTGPHHKGGFYGTDVNLIIHREEENNPNFQGCLDRGA